MSEEETINSGETVEETSPEEVTQPPSSSDEITLEYLEELIKDGWQLWVDRKKNKIRLRDPQTRKTISIPYDEAIYERLRKLKEEIRKERRAIRTKPAVVSGDLTLWNTFVGKHRPLIESLIARVSWLQDAIIDIGINTLLLVLMVTNEKPEDLVKVIGEIHDRDKFVAYIMNKIVDIYMAAKGADEISKLRERIAELEAKLALLEEALENYRQRYEEMKIIAGDLKTKLDIALSIMNERELRKMLKVMAVSSFRHISSRFGPPSGGPESESGGETE